MDDDRNPLRLGCLERRFDSRRILKLAQQARNDAGVTGVALVRHRERAVEVKVDRVRCAANQLAAHAPDTHHACRMRAGRPRHDRADGVKKARKTVGIAAAVRAHTTLGTDAHMYSSIFCNKPRGAVVC